MNSAQPSKIWRLMDVLKEATAFLENRGVEAARLNGERLMAHVLKLSRVELYLQFDQPLEPAEREAYKALLRRRADGEPLQYILGETEFMSLVFNVDDSVLIPRPETELLVERLVALYGKAGPVRILDIGTGSGAIAVSLAHYCPEAQVTAVDVSAAALITAKSNAGTHGLMDRIQWVEADLYAEAFAAAVEGPYDAVVSNPPYVAFDEWAQLPVEIRQHEPRLALCDEADGLTAYRRLAGVAASLLKPGGRMLVEVGDTQAIAVKNMFDEAGLHPTTVHFDLNHIGRAVEGATRQVSKELS